MFGHLYREARRSGCTFEVTEQQDKKAKQICLERWVRGWGREVCLVNVFYDAVQTGPLLKEKRTPHHT